MKVYMRRRIELKGSDLKTNPIMKGKIIETGYTEMGWRRPEVAFAPDNPIHEYDGLISLGELEDASFLVEQGYSFR